MIQIDQIIIQTLCHATESEEKVLEALGRLYSSFTRQKASGHLGNPICIFEAHVRKKREISAILDLLRRHVAPALLRDLERRIDKQGNIYVRFDKQELYRGNFLLRDNGEIKIIITVRSYPFKEEDVIHYAEEIFSD